MARGIFDPRLEAKIKHAQEQGKLARGLCLAAAQALHRTALALPFEPEQKAFGALALKVIRLCEGQSDPGEPVLDAAGPDGPEMYRILLGLNKRTSHLFPGDEALAVLWKEARHAVLAMPGNEHLRVRRAPYDSALWQEDRDYDSGRTGERDYYDQEDDDDAF